MEDLQVGGVKLCAAVKEQKNIGIGEEMLSDDVLSKTGRQLITDSEVIKELSSQKSKEVQNVLDLTLDEYRWAEWVTCLEYKVLLEYAIPFLSKVLSMNPCVAGFYYKGEVLYRIFKLNNPIWDEHVTWRGFFLDLLKELFNQYSEDEIKSLVEERMYRELKRTYVEEVV